MGAHDFLTIGVGSARRPLGSPRRAGVRLRRAGGVMIAAVSPGARRMRAAAHPAWSVEVEQRGPDPLDADALSATEHITLTHDPGDDHIEAVALIAAWGHGVNGRWSALRYDGKPSGACALVVIAWRGGRDSAFAITTSSEALRLAAEGPTAALAACGLTISNNHTPAEGANDG